MGQKANTLTLRKNNENLDFANLNLTELINSREFILAVRKAYRKKGIIFTESIFHKVNESVHLIWHLYFGSRILVKYRKKLKKKNILKNKINVSNFFRRNKSINSKLTSKKYEKRKLLAAEKGKRKKKSLSKTAKNKIILKKKIFKKKRIIKENYKSKNKKQKKELKIKKKKLLNKDKKIINIFKRAIKKNLIVFNCQTLNLVSKRRLSRIFFNDLKMFKKALFTRRFFLFYDFVNLTALFYERKINLESFCYNLGLVFKFLIKKSHSRFFIFAKKIFFMLIGTREKGKPFYNFFPKINGIKMQINGRLKGKLRANTYKLIVGKINTQTFSAKNDLSKTHIHTKYGCFGLTLWVNYRDENIDSLREIAIAKRKSQISALTLKKNKAKKKVLTLVKKKWKIGNKLTNRKLKKIKVITKNKNNLASLKQTSQRKNYNSMIDKTITNAKKILVKKKSKITKKKASKQSETETKKSIIKKAKK